MQGSFTLIKNCDLYVHALCFPKVPKKSEDFLCDQCANDIPDNAQCELCPVEGGHFLELIDNTPVVSYRTFLVLQELKRETLT